MPLPLLQAQAEQLAAAYCAARWDTLRWLGMRELRALARLLARLACGALCTTCWDLTCLVIIAAAVVDVIHLADVALTLR